MIGLSTVAILSIVIELGFQFGKRLAGESGLSKHPLEASVTTAILSLMAFMLGFMFANASARYSKLREHALADSNIASTLYRSAAFLPEAQVADTRKLIREYLYTRHSAIKTGSLEKVAEAIARSEEIQDTLWEGVVLARQNSNSSSLNLYTGTFNDLIDNDRKRQATAFANRMPAMIWVTMGFLGLLATTMLGMSSGLHGRRSRLATTALIVAFSTVFVLIVDLDRPSRSLFNFDDQAAERALKKMGE